MDGYNAWLVSPQRTLVGDGLRNSLTSWSEVEQWYKTHHGRSQQCLIGYLGYDNSIWFAVFDRLRSVPTPGLLPKTSLTKPKIKLTGAKWPYYLKNYNRVIKHLQLGDIYQVNLAERLSGHYAGTALELFTYLYQQQPTKYSAFIETPNFSIASNSPELFLKGNTTTVETRPMKGTRPRGTTVHNDKKLRQELLSSAKEQAELNMIIDVHRNDLARTAKPGSVRVTKAREIIPFKTVWQAQARIQAKCDTRYSILDTIRQCFPAGSITGAPKLRAMEIINELEQYPRQVYCGAIGYIAASGKFEFNVAIRTAILQDQTVYYSVGSGITLDSKPEAEYQEILDKANLFL